jgi:23S rRNA (cytidine1920-2'-O)/16S rRNA (cytidine1409-2'-O)-methyltransferase
MERSNAMHVQLPERMNLVVIDAGWTKQKNLLPHAGELLGHGGSIVTLIKPHYEAEASRLRRGVLPEECIPPVLEQLRESVQCCQMIIRGEVRSPIRGTGGNAEFLWWLQPAASA